MGKVRYQCPFCHRTFSRNKQLRVGFSAFCQFEKLVSGKQNRKLIASQMGIGRDTLSQRFKIFFDSPINPVNLWEILPPKISQDKSDWIYGVDGKYLHRQGVFLVHRDVTNKENLFWSFKPSESYVALETDLKTLAGLIDSFGGNYPVGAISDWKGSIVSAVASYLGRIPNQRCLTHVQHLSKRLLPERSPYLETRELRTIAVQLAKINIKREMVDWLWELQLWQHNHEPMLKERTKGVGTKKKWWYTHGNLRSGFRLLTHEQEPFFIYLDNPLIPKTNNSLEGINSQAVQKLGNHRGMKVSQQVSFLNWYFTFQRTKNKNDLKKLWVKWKKTFLDRLPTRNPT